MLSIHKLKSAADASTYYQQGDYYAQNGQSASFWLGKGAETLGLQGSVDFGVFKGLLGGYLPNGVMMTNTQNGAYHQPGYDLTFSAPKSVSILALVADNKDVLNFYREAVIEVMAKIEQKYAACRNKHKGHMTLEKTANFIIAAFEHLDSREGDPNLHTHLVLMNMTQKLTEEWRTIYSKEFYRDKLLNGMALRSLLSQKLLKAGYELIIKKDGTFEIAGVPKELLKYLSKRRNQIEDWLQVQGLSGGKAAKWANFYTRAPKKDCNPEQRKEYWIASLKEVGCSLEELKAIEETAKARGPITLPDPYLIAEQSVDCAVLHVAERQSFFSIPDLLKAAKLMSVLPANDADFLKAIEAKITNKSLIFVEGKFLTTPESEALKTQNNVLMEQGKHQVNKMAAQWIAAVFAHVKLDTKPQREALQFILTTEHRHILVTSHSTPLLNQTLKAFNELCQDHPYYPRFLTQKTHQVEALKKKLNSDRVGTIEGFLLSCEQRAEKQNSNLSLLARLEQRFKAKEARDIWVITGDISYSQVNRLQQWSSRFGARVIFTATRQTIPALERLKEGGISTLHLSTPKGHGKDLKVQEALLLAIHRLEQENAIQSVTEYGERLQTGLNQSLLSPEPAVLVTLSNTERTTLNTLMRAALIEKGTLAGNTVFMNTLQALSLSKAEKSKPHLYQPGDIIRFNREEPNTLIQKGSYFEVQKINLNTGVIELHDKENNQILWHPPTDPQKLKDIEVFSAIERELRVGETLVWTGTIPHETDKQFSRIKDQKALVIGVEKESAVVRLANGKTLTLNQADIHHHWDYGYVLSLKNVAAASLKKAVVVMHSQQLDHKIIHALEAFLHESGNVKVPVHLICDDLDTLKVVIAKGGMSSVLVKPKEAPYERADALSDHQTIATQPLFHRLQSEYLRVRQLNPEFLKSEALESLVALEAQKIDLSPEFRLACDSVERVCLYHAERDSVLNLRQMHLEAAQLGGLKTPIEKIEAAFALAIQKGWLIEVPKKSEDKWVTPRHTLLMEKQCIKTMKEGQNQLTPILPSDSPLLETIRNHAVLTAGQKEAIELILTTSDRFTAVQGIAGAGKTTALKEIHQACQTIGFKTFVLANTGAARNQAKQKSGMVSLTIAQFLSRVEPLLITDVNRAKREYGGSLMILDEASMISTRDRFRLQQVVGQLNIRSSGVGDMKQIGSIGAGNDFQDSLIYDINKALLTENVRLTEPNAFAALKAAYAGNMGGALNLLADSIEEIPDKNEALTWVVNVYFLLEKISPEQPLVIMPLNEDRRRVNQMIRERLKENQVLTGDSVTTAVLLPADRREIDKKEASSYEMEDVIRFNTRHPRLSIKAGEYVTVIDIDLKHERLTLKNDQGKIVYWSPKNLHKPDNIEIYREEKRELFQNEVIVFKRNDEQRGIFNGDKATIVKIEGNKAQTLLMDGTKVILDFSQKVQQHLDYGYALTPNVAQGKDVLYTVGYGEGPKPYWKQSDELQPGDKVVLPKEDQNYDKTRYHENAKIVEVLKIKNKQITFYTDGKYHTVNASKDRLWEYFPLFEERKAEELPLSTSQESFIVQMSRGNHFFLAVRNKSDFQKTLERHEQMNRSALSYFDPKWEDLNKGIKRLLVNISGKVEEKINQNETKELVRSSSVSNQAQLFKKTAKSQAKGFTVKKASFIDGERLNRHLNADILGYATRWLGSPKKISGVEARWSGALTLQFKGSKEGWWKRWSADREGGKDLISLYMNLHKIDYRTALKELAGMCGIEGNNIAKARTEPTVKQVEKNPKTAEQEIQEKLKFIHKEYAKGVPIPGTLAEKYLKQFRAIPGALPPDFRFKMVKHLDTKKLTPTLVAPIRDKDSKIIGLVRIYLNRDGSKITETYQDKGGKTQDATDKTNLGVANGGAVVVQQGAIGSTLWVAEGVETALSVAKAMPNYTVVASTSIDRFRIVPVSTDVQKVIICADNDGPQIPKAIIGAVEKHLSEGRRVFIAIPPEISAGFKKYDFNDVLKQEGMAKVQAILNNKVEIKNAELLKVERGSLSMALEKIRTAQQSEKVLGMSSLQPEKTKIDLER